MSVTTRLASTVRANERGQKARRGGLRLLRIPVLVLLAIPFLFPFFWLIATALKATPELAVYPVLWWPSHPEWPDFVRALTYIDYGLYARNSFELSAIYTVLVTISSALVGFGFARFRAPGLQSLFVLMLATTMVPQILLAIPTFELFSKFNLIYTYWPWVLWGVGANPLLAFLCRQFFAAIPRDLEDAALIDGCNYGSMFIRIFLPLSKPMLATVAIFAFQSVWGDWFTPLLFLKSNNTTLSVAMSGGYVDIHGNVLLNVLSSGVIIYMLPLAVLFFFAQRYFLQGIMTGGVKA